jgi:hypothetical protein
MIDDELAARVLQLYQTENFSMRQVAEYCGMCTKTVSRIIKAEGAPVRHCNSLPLIVPYQRLIAAWYVQHPKLKATQVYARLKGLGFTGSCATVERATRKLRTRKPVMFHERVLLPAEEAQVDWMVLSVPLGYGVRICLHPGLSRNLVVRFYPKMTFEFFLDGHLEAFRECMGGAHIPTVTTISRASCFPGAPCFVLTRSL